MILLFLVFLTNLILIQSKSYEISRTHSNAFLKSSIVMRTKYEEPRETIEANRESCLDEYREQVKANYRRNPLSPLCAQYCTETNDCEQNDEISACIHPTWPTRTRKYVAKFERMCYIRITQVLRYEQAERMCQKYGLQLAIIDNSRLLERLKQLNLFNISCQGQCPTAKGYYIGLKRIVDDDNPALTQWIWSNNITWIQNEIDCDNESYEMYPNATLLCYMGNDGQKKITVWNENEPNNHRTSIYHIGEQCVEIIAFTNRESSLLQVGKLNDIPCSKPALGVICQRKDLKPMNSKHFEHFATIVGFNQTEVVQDNALDNLLSQFGGLIPANLEAMSAMLEALESLLDLPAFTLGQATSVLNVVDQLVNVTGQVDVEPDSLKSVTNKLLHFLDLFPAKIQTENADNTSFKYENMNMSVVDINWQHESAEWFSIHDEHNSNTIVELNMRVLQNQLNDSNSSRIIETIFSNFNLFPQFNTTHLGAPISYTIANINSVQADEDLVRFRIRVSDIRGSDIVHCVYWSFDEQNGTWITDETCRFMGYVDNYAQCYCNHLTHFALLILTESKNAREPLSTIEEFILTFVTYIGICLSIVGLLLTLITYAVFGRSHRNHLHGSLMMLCFALLFVDNLFIPFAFIQSKLVDIKRIIACTIVAFFFHYFLLASFMWMLIIAIVQYMHFVRIFNSHISHFFTKTCFIGWMLPIIFPMIVVLLGSNGGYTSESRCWINNPILFYVTLIIPLSMIMVTNLFLFGFILKNIFHRNTVVVHHQRLHSKIQLGAAFCCFVSMGCTWLFAWFVVLRPRFLYQLLFCLCNSSQGFLIFLFHVYLSKPKREFWQIFFLSKQGQTDLSTITHTNSIVQHSKSSTTDQTKISST